MCIETDCISGKGLSQIVPAINGLCEKKLARYEEKGMTGRDIKAMVLGVVLNACAAQLKTYGRLIMDDADVESVCRAAPNATVIASHMDTVAHASLTRKTLRAALERRGLAGRVLMPDDGEEYSFN